MLYAKAYAHFTKILPNIKTPSCQNLACENGLALSPIEKRDNGQ